MYSGTFANGLRNGTGFYAATNYTINGTFKSGNVVEGDYTNLITNGSFHGKADKNGNLVPMK